MRPVVFREAAAGIAGAGGGLACCAIHRACLARELWAVEPYMDFFAELFRPRAAERVYPNLTIWWHWDDKEARMIALLLAAQIAKEGL